MLVSNIIMALILTVVIESFIAYLMGYRDRQSMVAVVAANAITNPLLNFVAAVVAHIGLSRWIYYFILPLEVLVIPIEWMLLSYAMPKKKKELLRLSAVINISSYIIGLLIF